MMTLPSSFMMSRDLPCGVFVTSDVHLKVKQGDRVTAGQELVRVDRKTIEDAGYSLTTPVLITNTDKFASVEVVAEGEISSNAPLIRVTAPEG